MGSNLLPFKILHKPENSISWEEFIQYETKEECIKYLENVNPTLRPATIVFGQRTLRAYDYGIIDYEDIAEVAQENQELRDNLWTISKKNVDK